MHRLEVSGAVRPLKWPLGVKWIIFPSLSTLHLTDVSHKPAWRYIQLRFVTETQYDTDHVMHCPRYGQLQVTRQREQKYTEENEESNVI
jgi:hypothetical protein